MDTFDNDKKWQRITRVLDALLLEAKLHRKMLQRIIPDGPELSNTILPEFPVTVREAPIPTLECTIPLMDFSQFPERVYLHPEKGFINVYADGSETDSEGVEHRPATVREAPIPTSRLPFLPKQMKEPQMADPTAQPNIIHKFKNIEHRVKALLAERATLEARAATIDSVLAALNGEVAAIEATLDSELSNTFPKTTDVKVAVS